MTLIGRMIIALSIVAGVLAAWLSYRILFYDSDDFCEGVVKCLGKSRGRRMISPKDPTPESFEDESWSSGFRFLLFVAVTLGSGCFAYYQLLKHFG